jgi:hypothetical protein
MPVHLRPRLNVPADSIAMPPRLVPCYLCGKPVTPMPPPRYYDAPGFAICPPAENLACLARVEEQLNAGRAGSAAPEAAPGHQEAAADDPGALEAPPILKTLLGGGKRARAGIPDSGDGTGKNTGPLPRRRRKAPPVPGAPGEVADSG